MKLGGLRAIKKNSNKYKLKNEVGMVVPKVHNKICRDSLSHPLYIPTLAF